MHFYVTSFHIIHHTLKSNIKYYICINYQRVYYVYKQVINYVGMG